MIILAITLLAFSILAVGYAAYPKSKLIRTSLLLFIIIVVLSTTFGFFSKDLTSKLLYP